VECKKTADVGGIGEEDGWMWLVPRSEEGGGKGFQAMEDGGSLAVRPRRASAN